MRFVPEKLLADTTLSLRRPDRRFVLALGVLSRYRSQFFEPADNNRQSMAN